jgi:hypothetical protein
MSSFCLPVPEQEVPISHSFRISRLYLVESPLGEIMIPIKVAFQPPVLVGLLLLIGCGGSGGGSTPVRTPYNVEGTVSGLSGSGLVLQNNGADNLPITGNGVFTFAAAMVSGNPFNVTVLTQPTDPAQTCTVVNGSGTISSADITKVAVTCSTNAYTIGGTISGLSGLGLVLQNNGGDDLSLNAERTSFTFPRAVASGGQYSVTVLSQPSGQTCLVTRGSGTVGSANVMDVAVACFPSTLSLDAVPGGRSATLSWSYPQGFSFNLYRSTAPNCDIHHYMSCPGGTLSTNVTSPRVVTGLSNGTAYYFRLEAVNSGTTIGLSNEAGVRPDVLVTNRIPVWALATAPNGTVYLGGNFTRIGVRSGGGLPFDLETGRASPPTFPIVEGDVVVAAADGSNGWYIGGQFTTVGGMARRNVAHIRSDGSLDPNWAPDANRPVLALAVAGDTVYAGGDFTSIGGQTRNRIAALDTSGAASSWNPNANDTVWVLSVSGSTIYVGGNFSSIGGETRHSLAALDASSGMATPWDPDVGGGLLFGSAVYSLAISNNTVYAGGYYGFIGGQARNCVAALDASTGSATPWNPDSTGAVVALVVRNNTVYAAGGFYRIGGQTRNGLAALDASTGNATAWNPNPNYDVSAIAVSGATVYVAGSFTRIGGQTRNRLAALDESGAALSWNPDLDDSVHALAVSGSSVYAGGFFRLFAGQVRNNIAALDASGALLSWNPDADGPIFALVVSGDTIYAGGAFRLIGGQVRNNIAALDASGALLSWNPDANGTVEAIAVSGTTVYVAGGFSFIGGQPRNSIAAVGSSGEALTWNPAPNNSVLSLAVSDGTVYAGGYFTSIGGQPRNRIAALDASGEALDWDPNADGPVEALAISDSIVYAGGYFRSVGGQVRNNIAALDASGAALSWSPNADRSVFALAVSGSTVYAGGDFSSIGGQERQNIAALDASGAALGWDPNPNDQIKALAVSGSTVYAGGGFTSIDGELRIGIAALDTPDAARSPVR